MSLEAMQRTEIEGREKQAETSDLFTEAVLAKGAAMFVAS